MSLRERAVYFDGFACCRLSARKRIFRWKTASKSKQCVGVGQTAISQAVVRLSGDCLLEVHDAFVQRVFSSLVEVISALQVILISFGPHSADRCQTRPPLRREAALDSPGDTSRDVILQTENASIFSLVFFSPNVFVGRAANQLRVYANVAALACHRPFDNGVYAERLGNLRNGELRVFEVHGRGAGDDSQTVDVRQPPNKLLGHAVRDVFLRRISA